VPQQEIAVPRVILASPAIHDGRSRSSSQALLGGKSGAAAASMNLSREPGD
jgi:hypothetical protein